MKVFVSKYALTKGIEEVEGKISDSFPDMFHPDKWYGTLHKGEWHLTMGEAVEKAREKRTKKIASLKKQLAKVEKMEF